MGKCTQDYSKSFLSVPFSGFKSVTLCITIHLENLLICQDENSIPLNTHSLFPVSGTAPALLCLCF